MASDTARGNVGVRLATFSAVAKLIGLAKMVLAVLVTLGMVTTRALSEKT